MRTSRWNLAICCLATLGCAAALADVRVQDVARLQGQRSNKLTGWGLVVGLDATGDGAKSPATLRALAEVHRIYHSPVLDLAELKANNNVAIVLVEVTIPEFGAREGQALDVSVSAVGPAKSIRGGRLLTTPLQDSTLVTQDILAFATGRVDVLDAKNPKVGLIRGGCTLEEDFYYTFIEDGAITLVLDDSKAGYQWAQVVARAVDHELSSLSHTRGSAAASRVISVDSFAQAIDAKNVRVRIPSAELDRPASFISRVLQSVVFETPRQQARVLINRATNEVSFTGSVTISPTVLHLPGLGAVSVGGGGGKDAGGASIVGVTTDKDAVVAFQDLLNTLAKLQLPPEQVVRAIEHLHRTGSLNAQLSYAE